MPTLPGPLQQAPLPDPASRSTATRGPDPDVAASRHRLLVDALGITLSAFSFAIVYGLSSRQHDFSVVDALAMSVFVLAGASQFAAVGLLAQGLPWLAVVGFTGLLNARHVLYAAALAPWFAGRSRLYRAAAAHVLTDETFALALPHFRRLRRFDGGGYWLAAGLVVLPWIGGTALGFAGGELLPDTNRLGLDIVFPAAMAGLATALISGRRELVAAAAAVAIGLPVALLTQPPLGIVAGGLGGPLVAMPLLPFDATDRAEAESASATPP
jgi:4-azaleucine resistance transporter AzlC